MPDLGEGGLLDVPITPPVKLLELIFLAQSSRMTVREAPRGGQSGGERGRSAQGAARGGRERGEAARGGGRKSE